MKWVSDGPSRFPEREGSAELAGGKGGGGITEKAFG